VLARKKSRPIRSDAGHCGLDSSKTDVSRLFLSLFSRV
jgi:hypothetical protein